jgi:hypothetical protein
MAGPKTSASRNPVTEMLKSVGVPNPWDSYISNFISVLAILFFISLLM